MKRAGLVFLSVTLVVLSIGLVAGRPSRAVAEGTPGSSPQTAIPLSATMTGTLGPGATRWFQFSGDGSSPAGVVLNFVPNSLPLSSNVYFNVDWTQQDGQANADWPGFWRVGQGTPSGLPPGERYWFSQTTQLATYDVEVVNSSNTAVGYALALMGAQFPPPYLNPPAPGAAAAAVPAGPLPPSSAPGPTVTATVIPTATVGPQTLNQATDSSGLTLQPQVQTDGPFSTVFVRVTSTNPVQIPVSRIRILPPNGAVIDGLQPTVASSDNGVVWFPNFLVDPNTPLAGYSLRFWGSANGTVVEVDWATAKSNGALTVTLQNAPQPAPPSDLTPQSVPQLPTGR